MSKENTTNIIKVSEELENISVDMVNIMQCLETIENSMYFASERADKDITKPCAAATEMVIRMVSNLQERVEELGSKLKATIKEA